MQLASASQVVQRERQELAKLLACDICGEILKDPHVSIQCGHTSCYECWAVHWDWGGNHNKCLLCDEEGSETIFGPYPIMGNPKALKPPKLQRDYALVDIVRKLFPRPEVDALIKEHETQLMLLQAVPRLPGGKPAELKAHSYPPQHIKLPFTYETHCPVFLTGQWVARTAAHPSNGPATTAAGGAGHTDGGRTEQLDPSVLPVGRAKPSKQDVTGSNGGCTAKTANGLHMSVTGSYKHGTDPPIGTGPSVDMGGRIWHGTSNGVATMHFNSAVADGHVGASCHDGRAARPPAGVPAGDGAALDGAPPAAKRQKAGGAAEFNGNGAAQGVGPSSSSGAVVKEEVKHEDQWGMTVGESDVGNGCGNAQVQVAERELQSVMQAAQGRGSDVSDRIVIATEQASRLAHLAGEPMPAGQVGSVDRTIVLHRPYVVMPWLATVHHLQTYLRKQLHVAEQDSQVKIKVYCNNRLLHPQTSLMTVYNTYWNTPDTQGCMLQLTFHVSRTL